MAFKKIIQFQKIFLLLLLQLLLLINITHEKSVERDGKVLKLFQTLLSMGNTNTKVHSSSDYYQYNTNSNNNLYGGSPTNSAGLGNALTKLGLFGDDFDLGGLMDLVNFGLVENMLGKVNSFDQLRCIPRMICQMVAKRKEESKSESSSEVEISSTTPTTTTTTKNPENNEEEPRNGRFIKIHGVDTALGQFVSFLDVMQMKNWAMYPYLSGAEAGYRVTSWTECNQQFNTCPFSDDQLVHYFNNYKGGFFQALRSQ